MYLFLLLVICSHHAGDLVLQRNQVSETKNASSHGVRCCSVEADFEWVRIEVCQTGTQQSPRQRDGSDKEVNVLEANVSFSRASAWCNNKPRKNPKQCSKCLIDVLWLPACPLWLEFDPAPKFLYDQCLSSNCVSCWMLMVVVLVDCIICEQSVFDEEI